MLNVLGGPIEVLILRDRYRRSWSTRLAGSGELFAAFIYAYILLTLVIEGCTTAPLEKQPKSANTTNHQQAGFVYNVQNRQDQQNTRDQSA
jgi:hypothetical protein